MTSFHPIVFWGQSKDYTLLSVKIKSVKNPKIEIDEESLKFSAEGEGSNGYKNYDFTINYYLPVKADESSWVIKENFIEIKLKKEYKDAWPRLTFSADKIPWLKCDFNNFFFDESDEENNSDKEFELKRKEAFSELMDNKKIEESTKFYNEITKPLNLYLLFYNLFQYAGFLYVFGACIYVIYKYGSESGKRKAYSYVKDQLITIQVFAILEIAHAALGWVKSSPVTVAMQVFGRNLVLIFVVLPHESLHEDPLFFWLAITWSSIEIIRYPYYLLILLNETIDFLTWLRYTAWIPLYPIGFMTEGRLILKAMPLLAESGRFSLSLPNKWNFQIDLLSFLYLYIPAACFGFYVLMMRMYKQRRHKLGPHLEKNWKDYNLLKFLVDTFGPKGKRKSTTSVTRQSALKSSNNNNVKKLK